MNVTTINGEVVLKKNARKIKGIDGEFNYYKIGNIEQKDSGDCYKINNIYYTVEKQRIAWDYASNIYALRSSLVEGIVNNGRNSFTSRGYFTKNDKVVKGFTNNTSHVLILNKELALELGYLEGTDGNFYNMNFFTYDYIYPREMVSRDYKNALDYTLQTSKVNTKPYAILKSDINLENVYKQYSNILNSYSFGIEMETLRGIIPISELERLNINPLRDGSINGLEYVSLPLKGKTGLYNFKEMLENVIKYTDSDYTCSMHVHVGGIPRTPEFITAAFKVNYLIQNDLFKLFPDYKQFNTGVKKKCYTSPLDSSLMISLTKTTKSEEIEKNCSKIVNHLTSNYMDYSKLKLDEIESHPRDPGNSAKWNIIERYKFFNLIPLIFTNKQTIEYRIFTQPDTIDKGIFFLMLSLLITDYIVKNQQFINSNDLTLDRISLYEILGSYGRGVYDSFRSRSEQITRHKSYKGSHFEENIIKTSEYLYPRNSTSSLSNKASSYTTSWRDQYLRTVVAPEPTRRAPKINVDELETGTSGELL